MGSKYNVEVRVHEFVYMGDRDEKILRYGFTTPFYETDLEAVADAAAKMRPPEEREQTVEKVE